MRIAIGGIEHETNTYATEIMGPTTLDRFRVVRGQALLGLGKYRTMIGGLINGCEDDNHEIVPLLWAWAGPSGVVDRDTYEGLKGELLDRLREAGQVDAIGLSMHGAGVVDGIDDLEADLAAAIRDVAGDTPLAVPLDLHGNITAEMGESIDLMLGVHEYPHTDSFERGVETIGALAKMASGAWRPTTFVQPVPIMLPPSTTDAGFPAASIRDRCLAAEENDHVIDATFFHGFPFTDVAATGCSIVVTTNDAPERAEQIAKRLAGELWSNRQEFVLESVPPSAAVEVARRTVQERGGPVVINDTADNAGGGSPADGTHLLQALIDADVPDSCFGFICDPIVAAAAAEAGTGATIDVRLGGRHGDLHGQPIETSAYVKTLSDGNYVYTNPMLAGVESGLGTSTRLQLGGSGGLDVIVTSGRSQTFDPGVFALHGIDVSTRSIIALKSSQHFRGGFRDIATEIVTADSPGLTTLDVTVFDHTKAPGPIWPHDRTMTWEP